MEILDIMINGAFKKSAGYKYYKAKKVESKKETVAEEPEEHNVSPIKSGKGKRYMRSDDNEANVPKMFKKVVMPRKTRSLTIAKETVVVELAKSISIDEQRTQQHRRNTSKENANGTDDADDSNKSIWTYLMIIQTKMMMLQDLECSCITSPLKPKSTYLNPIITTSSLDFIQNLLDETPVNELTDLMSNLVYTDAHTTSVVHSLKGNPKEMFPDDAAHHISSPPTTKTHKLPTNTQSNSLQAKAKKLMQKAKKNIRNINFKKVVA
nr:hypothetical protein [Tanacetum cinerariifolium]